MRGKQPMVNSANNPSWNIPAYAGKTSCGNLRLRLGKEHPRVCGENAPAVVPVTGGKGTSPRMRGKPASATATTAVRGNIPAYAGKTAEENGHHGGGAEHPRVCGDNGNGHGGYAQAGWNIPAYAGKTLVTVLHFPKPEDIPAYAGKTHSSDGVFAGAWEHPRVCGENKPRSRCWPCAYGTSPRMRGKQRCVSGRNLLRRNIPAYAGKTPRWSKQCSTNTEHPRVCGENGGTLETTLLGKGTSPRMRGKPIG